MGTSTPNYIWRKSVSPNWLSENESDLLRMTSGTLAVIEKPGRERVALEAPCRGAIARRLRQVFGGKSEPLPRNWIKPFLYQVAKPIRIGKRLVVTNVASNDASKALVVPASAAFGTGEHATTAMSLRLLEGATRRLTSGWRMLDAGTGSGILALAGKRFGAAEIIAIDNDALAISVANQNARTNRIRGVKFVVGDVTKAFGGRYEIITANLYSELLVSVLPKFRTNLATGGHLILSGVLRKQEPQLRRALRANGFTIHQTRRRGKWIALLAARDQKQS